MGFGTPPSPVTVNVAKGQVEVGFNSDPVNDTVAVDTADQPLTEGAISVSLPDGAVVKKASLLCVLGACQNGTTQTDVDADVFLAKDGEAYGAAVLELAPVLMLTEYKGTTVAVVLPVDVSAKVDAVGDYKCQVKVTQSEANSVKYVSSFILIVSYSMA